MNWLSGSKYILKRKKKEAARKFSAPNAKARIVRASTTTKKTTSSSKRKPKAQGKQATKTKFELCASEPPSLESFAYGAHAEERKTPTSYFQLGSSEPVSPCTPLAEILVGRPSEAEEVSSLNNSESPRSPLASVPVDEELLDETAPAYFDDFGY